jgi:hypothetical protein
VVFELTEEQRDHLAFAITCQMHELATCDEVDTPDVQEAMRSLYEVSLLLEAGRPL